MNPGFGNHVVMVWDTYYKSGQWIARCLPLTSFDSRSVDMKYRDGARQHRFRYLAISHPGMEPSEESPALSGQ